MNVAHKALMEMALTDNSKEEEEDGGSSVEED